MDNQANTQSSTNDREKSVAGVSRGLPARLEQILRLPSENYIVPKSVLREAAETITLLQGAMDAQDEREAQAGERCGVSRLETGCDWPDSVAEQIIALRARAEAAEDRVAQLTEALKQIAAVQYNRFDAEQGSLTEHVELAEQALAGLRPPSGGQG